MKIAQVVPLMHTVPPRAYGGIEAVVAELTSRLARRGHELTLFASKGSTLRGENITLVESSPFPTIEDLSKNGEWEARETEAVLGMQDEFDLVHLHYEPLIVNRALESSDRTLLGEMRRPFLHTFHNTTHLSKHVAYYRSRPELWDVPCAFISASQRAPLPFWRAASVIHNGIATERFAYAAAPSAEPYALFIGRLARIKGVVEAIAAARRATTTLIIAGTADEPDRAFFEAEVVPLMDGEKVVFAGEANFAKKVALYRGARATLVPLQWEEPFGLVMAESLACGTPVIAFDRGAASEIVTDGETGFIVRTVEEMADALARIGEIDRLACRRRAEEKLDAERMVDDYERLYHAILRR